jgi:hypothetical protein
MKNLNTKDLKWNPKVWAKPELGLTNNQTKNLVPVKLYQAPGSYGPYPWTEDHFCGHFDFKEARCDGRYLVAQCNKRYSLKGKLQFAALIFGGLPLFFAFIFPIANYFLLDKENIFPFPWEQTGESELGFYALIIGIGISLFFLIPASFLKHKTWVIFDRKTGNVAIQSRKLVVKLDTCSFFKVVIASYNAYEERYGLCLNKLPNKSFLPDLFRSQFVPLRHFNEPGKTRYRWRDDYAIAYWSMLKQFMDKTKPLPDSLKYVIQHYQNLGVYVDGSPLREEDKLPRLIDDDNMVIEANNPLWKFYKEKHTPGVDFFRDEMHIHYQEEVDALFKEAQKYLAVPPRPTKRNFKRAKKYMKEMERNGWQNTIYYKQWEDFLNGTINREGPTYDELVKQYEAAKKQGMQG